MFGDPVLQTNPYGVDIQDLEKEQAMLQQKLMQLKQNGQQPQQSHQSPVWDEIDRITSSLSDKEYSALAANKEFQASNSYVMTLLQREYMKIMRPIVEDTKEGKEALEKHLSLLKKLVKGAKEESAHREAMLTEYMTQYSHLTWKQYIELKNKENERNEH